MGDPVQREQSPHWYLVRTKFQKEAWARDEFTQLLPEVFLPLFRTKRFVRSHEKEVVRPLFPGYLFARLDLNKSRLTLKYTRAVRELGVVGGKPLVIPDAIVDALRTLTETRWWGRRPPLLNVVTGFNKIFVLHVSDDERVRILLAAVEASMNQPKQVTGLRYGRPQPEG